jgi:PEP-CTERM motif
MKGNQMNKFKSSILAIVAGLVTSAVSGQAQSATATISGVAVTGGFDYTITLMNPISDTFSLKSFWYGWTANGNNLPSNPSTAANSLGWVNVLFGNSIQWGNSSSTALAPGQSGTFTFFSTDSPTAITTTPAAPYVSGDSVVYVGAIDFSQGQGGDSSVVFAPTLVAVPEPSSLAMLAIGSAGLLTARWRKRSH